MGIYVTCEEMGCGRVLESILILTDQLGTSEY